MMYRRNAAMTPRPAARQLIALAGALRNAGVAAVDLFQLMQLAWRENRRKDRAAKRAKWYRAAQVTGLNGARAMARRMRNGAHTQQVFSHLPGTVWPAHLGPRWPFAAA